MILPPLYAYDAAVLSRGFPLLAGVDEAGRGPLAGPVYAAAVILPAETPIEGINDSKKLSEKKREILFEEIIQKALAYSIVSLDPGEIDQLNILGATLKAMRLAVQQLAITPDYVLIDGNAAPALAVPNDTVVSGDATSASIAAASILAKVARDRYMIKLDEQYPEYRFAQHKGYPTKLHYNMLNQYGASPVHRESFLKKWRAQNHGT